ncbi:MAG: glycosyltransferase, partial [Prevotellaceae bacterium]|nr:glycosyltransferase [Prevotellaceae bacterium]
MRKESGTLSIIIPVYNEEKTVHLILDKICAVDLIGDVKKEIIIVDDCSQDNTAKIIENYIAAHIEFDIKSHNCSVNKGKGAA